MPIMLEHGGRIAAFADAALPDRGAALEAVEEAWDAERTVLVEFPTVAAAREWYMYGNDEYTELKQHRMAASTGSVTIFEGAPPPARQAKL